MQPSAYGQDHFNEPGVHGMMEKGVSSWDEQKQFFLKSIIILIINF